MDRSQINKCLIGVALVLFAVLSFLSSKAYQKSHTSQIVTDTPDNAAVSPTPSGPSLTKPNIKERPRVTVSADKVDKDSIVLSTNQMMTLINKNASNISFTPPVGTQGQITIPDGRFYEMRFQTPGRYTLTLKMYNTEKQVLITVL
jgi:hypothetical protein